MNGGTSIGLVPAQVQILPSAFFLIWTIDAVFCSLSSIRLLELGVFLLSFAWFFVRSFIVFDGILLLLSILSIRGIWRL